MLYVLLVTLTSLATHVLEVLFLWYIYMVNIKQLSYTIESGC